jgi:uncharacterized protein YPO0396
MPARRSRRRRREPARAGPHDYNLHVPGRLTADDLTQLLERLTVERAGAQSSVQAGDAQIEMLCARVTLLTEALRDAEASDAGRLAARMLLADLAQVTTQFRGRTNSLRASLEAAVNEMRAALGADHPPSNPSA